MKVIQLSGAPRTRGEIYGEEARDLIRIAVAGWEENVGDELGVAPERYLEELVDRTEFISATQRIAPEILEEIEGIAAGSGFHWRRIGALSFMDEDWWLRRRRFKSASLEHCSSFGFSEDTDGVIIGQNMDLPRWLGGLEMLLDIQADGDTPAMLVLTYAGMLGLNGMSARGLGVCVNTLPQLPCSDKGVPVAVIIRCLMASNDCSEAIQLLRNIRHASGQNYLLGGRNRIADVECSALGAVEIDPAPRLAHTNHPLGGAVAHGVTTEQDAGVAATSHERLAHLRARLAESQTMTMLEAISLLREAPLWREEVSDTAKSLYSVVMDVQARTMAVSTGATSRDGVEKFVL